MASEDFLKHLKEREGVRNESYKDSLGKLTGGVGHLLTPEEQKLYPEGTKIPQEVVDKWLEQDLAKAQAAAKKQTDAMRRQGRAVDPRFEESLISVNFQLGENWTQKFPTAWKNLQSGDYQGAISQIQFADPTNKPGMKSKWAEQTPVRVDDFTKAIQAQAEYVPQETPEQIIERRMIERGNTPINPFQGLGGLNNNYYPMWDYPMFKKGGKVKNKTTNVIDVSADRLPYDRLQEIARRSMMQGDYEDRMADYDQARFEARRPFVNRYPVDAQGQGAYSTAAPMGMQAQRMMGFADGGPVDNAQGLASLGRGGDSMLVHMQPQEVAGLQRLAQANGTSLTQNPYTGMPEAFSLGGVFKAAAPIAAGYFTGGAGLGLGMGAQIAAGAITGGALAALTGDDPIMGAVSGGMGGVSGGGLADFMGAGLPAATETAAATAPLSNVAGAASYNPALNSAAFNPMNPPVPVTGMTLDQAKSGLTTGGGYNPITGSVAQGGKLSFSDAFKNPSNFLQTGKENLQLLADKEAMKTPFMVDETGKAFYRPASEVTTLNAVTKLGSPLASLGMGGIEESDLMPDTGYLDDARARDKYDSTKRLNLNMDTGISEALRRDSGLRLLAQGGYLDGGRIGDGMSDSVRANIDGQQEARLSEGEFVVPADVVSHLGNGSSDAGAQRLYSMMDRVRKARTGTKQQGRQIDPRKYMPR